jgi:hypothetical protein
MDENWSGWETYTLRRTEGGWKIAGAMIHDPDTILRSA